MHEFSVSQAIANLVLEESRKREAKRVLLVEVEIGELSLLNPAQVEFWLRLAFERTPASEAELKLEVTKPQIECGRCGYRGGLSFKDDPVYHFLIPAFRCPRCDSAEIVIRRGRGCRVRKIEILTEEDEPAQAG